MSKFEQEHRYYVIKRKHLDGYSEAMVINLLEKLNLPELECVVVESDWPMYKDVWKMIQQFVETGDYRSLVQQCNEMQSSFEASLSRAADTIEALEQKLDKLLAALKVAQHYLVKVHQDGVSYNEQRPNFSHERKIQDYVMVKNAIASVEGGK